MSLLAVRKTHVLLEEVFLEAGKVIDPPVRKVTVAAVIRNPFAGEYQEELEPLYDLGKEVGGLLAKKGVLALGVEPDQVEAYGKGAIVGIDGEIEHAAAILHPRFGAPVRAAVGKGDDIIPSTKKVGGAGASLLFPITNKNTIWDFDRMDAAEISIADAPRPDEILVALGLAIGGRPLSRTKPDS
jgi:hypothetical protein